MTYSDFINIHHAGPSKKVKKTHADTIKIARGMKKNNEIFAG